MNLLRTTTIVASMLAFWAAPAAAFIGIDDQAPMFNVVNEDLEAFDMASMLDGTPLVFIYGSAT